MEQFRHSPLAMIILGGVFALVLALSVPSGDTTMSKWSGTSNSAAAFSGEARPQRSGSSSIPLAVVGDVGFNIRAALDASGGAIRNVRIAPGQTWSFNAAVGDPAHVEVRSINGIAGGGWCDLASRYVQALRPLLPPDAIAFPNHLRVTNGIRIADVADADAVSIWNIGGQAGSAGGAQDLQITNTLSVPIQIKVEEAADGRSLVVRAYTQR